MQGANFVLALLILKCVDASSVGFTRGFTLNSSSSNDVDFFNSFQKSSLHQQKTVHHFKQIGIDQTNFFFYFTQLIYCIPSFYGFTPKHSRILRPIDISTFLQKAPPPKQIFFLTFIEKCGKRSSRISFIWQIFR